MTPSQARIDAALRLAEAAEVYERRVADVSMPEEPESRAFIAALYAYRATLPKLRTRDEVDAEIVDAARAWIRNVEHTAEYSRLKRLCREPTAPEPAPEGKEQ